MHRSITPLPSLILAATLSLASLQAADSAAVAAWKARGIETTETKGEISGVTVKAGTTLTEADFRQIRQIAHLKSLSCAAGFDDAALKALAGLSELESFSSNGANLSDEGVHTLATFKALRSVAFFHPIKGFKGTGLEALAELPHLERLTVAGSADFGDEGMSALAKIAHLKEFRTWHSGVGLDGVKKLSALKELKTLTLGQRLATKPPATVSDDAVVALADVPSLEALSLQEARLSLTALGKLKKLPHLKKLTLDGIELSDADLASLRQQLPQVEVKWTAPNEAAQKRIKSLF